LRPYTPWILLPGTIFAKVLHKGELKMEPTDKIIFNYHLFKKMKELAEKQEKAILEEKIDEFNNIINLRERIRREIISNTRQYESAIKKSPQKKEDHRVKEISSEISELIHAIQEIDKKIEESVIERKDSLMNDIKKIQKGQSALKGYGGTQKKINTFLNRKG
jgi:hypothetical protein